MLKIWMRHGCRRYPHFKNLKREISALKYAPIVVVSAEHVLNVANSTWLPAETVPLIAKVAAWKNRTPLVFRCKGTKSGIV